MLFIAIHCMHWDDASVVAWICTAGYSWRWSWCMFYHHCDYDDCAWSFPTYFKRVDFKFIFVCCGFIFRIILNFLFQSVFLLCWLFSTSTLHWPFHVQTHILWNQMSLVHYVIESCLFCSIHFRVNQKSVTAKSTVIFDCWNKNFSLFPFIPLDFFTHFGGVTFLLVEVRRGWTEKWYFRIFFSL